MLVVHPEHSGNHRQELIAHAKADPGKLTVRQCQYLRRRGGCDAEALGRVRYSPRPYKSAPNALQDLLPGRVSMMFTTSRTSLPHIQSKALRGIASTRLKRSSLFPSFHHG